MEILHEHAKLSIFQLVSISVLPEQETQTILYPRSGISEIPVKV
jgi:hypothetical protein